VASRRTCAGGESRRRFEGQLNLNRPFSPLLAFAWTLSFVFVMQALATLLFRVRPAAADDIVSLASIEAAVCLLMASAVLYLHGKDVPLGASLGLRPTHPALLFLAMLLGFTVHFPAEAADIAVQRLIPSSALDLKREMALLTADTAAGKAMILFFVACVGPLVEEVLFRGALFGALRRHRSFAATTFTVGACFVVAHAAPAKWPALAVVAFTMTYVRSLSGSLFPTIAMHVVFNAITGVAFALGQVIDDPANRKIEILPTVVFSAITGLLIVAIRYIASRAPAARRGRAEDAE
jgi:membrane protease YdiL (CAAX protease family)